MASYSLSAKAQSDLASIYKYGIKYFRKDQVCKYLYELEDLMLKLSTSPELSKDASSIASTLKYYNFKAHVIFYIQKQMKQIYVVRVLGKRMNFIEDL